MGGGGAGGVAGVDRYEMMELLDRVVDEEPPALPPERFSPEVRIRGVVGVGGVVMLCFAMLYCYGLAMVRILLSGHVHQGRGSICR